MSFNARDQRRRNARRQTPIAAEFEDCVQLFYQLCSAMEADSATWEGSDIPINGLQSRFKAFGSDARVPVIDYTLRKASRLRDQVLNLLKPFKEELQNGRFSSSVWRRDTWAFCWKDVSHPWGYLLDCIN